jgi:hypothetical protein
VDIHVDLPSELAWDIPSVPLKRFWFSLLFFNMADAISVDTVKAAKPERLKNQVWVER